MFIKVNNNFYIDIEDITAIEILYQEKDGEKFLRLYTKTGIYIDSPTLNNKEIQKFLYELGFNYEVNHVG